MMVSCVVFVVILIISIVICYPIAVGLVLDCSWVAIGLLLHTYTCMYIHMPACQQLAAPCRQHLHGCKQLHGCAGAALLAAKRCRLLACRHVYVEVCICKNKIYNIYIDIYNMCMSPLNIQKQLKPHSILRTLEVVPHPSTNVIFWCVSDFPILVHNRSRMVREGPRSIPNPMQKQTEL